MKHACGLEQIVLSRTVLHALHAQLRRALWVGSSRPLAICSACPTVRSSCVLWRHLLAFEWFRRLNLSLASPCSHIGMSRRISRSKARPSRRSPSSLAAAKLLFSLVGIAEVRADHVCRNTFCLRDRGILSSDLFIPLARIASATRAQSGMASYSYWTFSIISSCIPLLPYSWEYG